MLPQPRDDVDAEMVMRIPLLSASKFVQGYMLTQRSSKRHQKLDRVKDGECFLARLERKVKNGEGEGVHGRNEGEEEFREKSGVVGNVENDCEVCG